MIGSSETVVFYRSGSFTADAGPHRSRPPHGDLITAAAREHDIDPALLQAIISVESADNPNARSPVGARGLMQVMPATGRRFGVADEMRLHEPETNIRAASRYLKTLQGMFGNDLRLVLAAYNAGEGAVQRYGRNIPPYRETQDYVRKVMARYDQLLTARRSSFR
ncbi:Membrane-bound lytic murein transglycosylase E [Brevundimonas diminuta 3F5N]|uniref:Membrane-bound lytic murein transglycosylase E n=1 Tax=Brevundimonas diminuta 3F5N TaxID=1255603 RepID=A0A1R4G0T0_BREDI|nr:lytic transglycosylase domain-containing protein [Brevundimonas diminuta]SJM61731.1 Membrane-bound lytic murein transglycosylase E [Brevundimonas diminuta 3F5N]